MPRKLSELVNIPGSMTDLGSHTEEAPPVVRAPVVEETSSATPDAAVTDQVDAGKTDAELDQEAKDSLESYEKTPVQLWEEELSGVGLTRDKAMAILDNIMVNGLHSESYRVGKTKISLRTRTTVDADRLMEILQDQQPETTGVYAHLVTRVNLASSIGSYGNTTFGHTAPNDENRELLDYEWRERYRFCASLPAPAFYTLGQILQQFDERVSLACDSRGVENF